MIFLHSEAPAFFKESIPNNLIEKFICMFNLFLSFDGPDADRIFVCYLELQQI